MAKKYKVILISGSETGCRYADFLCSRNDVNLVLAVTGRDTARGRGRNKKRAVVADFCDSTSIEVYQPENINSPESLKKIKAPNPDLGIVVDYGQILSREALELFSLGAYNIHYSLLPDLRGASPVRGALLRGYSETGVTLMEMNEKIDRGAIVFRGKTEIKADDNYKTLKEKLTGKGIELLNKFLNNLTEGKEIKTIPQTECKEGNYISKIDKNICRIDWVALSARDIFNRIRAMAPSPACFTYLEKGKMRFKLLKGEICGSLNGKPGEVLEVDKKSFTVGCADKSLKILEIQPAGKRAMPVAAYLAGHDISKGDKLL